MVAPLPGGFTADQLVEKAAPPYRAIHAIADRLVPQARRAFLDAIARIQGTTAWRTISEQIAAGDWRFVGDMERTLGAELTPSLRQALERAVVQAGQVAASRLPQSIATQLSFELTNPFAVQAVDRQVATVVQDLVGVNSQALLSVLRQGFTQGVAPRDMARRMRDYVGLTEHYALAVERLRGNLLETGLAPAKVDAAASRYAERLQRLRALTIARTETIRAANLGQQAAWQDAESKGLLDQNTARQVWIVTPDDRLCPICEAIPDLNADGVPLGGTFQSEAGPLDGPPAHPSCRCAVGLQFPEEL